VAGEQRARQVDPAAVGQPDVHDRHVGLGVLDGVDPRGDVARGGDDVQPALPEQHREALAERLVVVDDHQLRHGAPNLSRRAEPCPKHHENECNCRTARGRVGRTGPWGAPWIYR
jgi:hypothetical protein